MTPSQKKITAGYRAIHDATRSMKGLSAKALRRHSRVRLEDQAEVLIRGGASDAIAAREVGLPITNVKSVRERRMPRRERT